MKIFCVYCPSDQLSSSKIISFKFSSSISAALSQSDCCSIRSASSMGIKSLSTFFVQCAGNLPLLITHTLLSGDLVWLNLNFEAKLRLPTLYKNGLPESITPGACPLFYEQKGITPQRQARLIGGTGLYMNYSIILTEISFYPETSILLQIIRIIHMTFWIIPEFDR